MTKHSIDQNNCGCEQMNFHYFMRDETLERRPLTLRPKKNKKTKKGTPPYPPRPREKRNKENSEGGNPPAHRKRNEKRRSRSFFAFLLSNPIISRVGGREGRVTPLNRVTPRRAQEPRKRMEGTPSPRPFSKKKTGGALLTVSPVMIFFVFLSWW